MDIGQCVEEMFHGTMEKTTLMEHFHLERLRRKLAAEIKGPVETLQRVIVADLGMHGPAFYDRRFNQVPVGQACLDSAGLFSIIKPSETSFGSGENETQVRRLVNRRRTC